MLKLLCSTYGCFGTPLLKLTKLTPSAFPSEEGLSAMTFNKQLFHESHLDAFK